MASFIDPFLSAQQAGDAPKGDTPVAPWTRFINASGSGVVSQVGDGSWTAQAANDCQQPVPQLTYVYDLSTPANSADLTQFGNSEFVLPIPTLGKAETVTVTIIVIGENLQQNTLTRTVNGNDSSAELRFPFAEFLPFQGQGVVDFSKIKEVDLRYRAVCAGSQGSVVFGPFQTITPDPCEALRERRPIFSLFSEKATIRRVSLTEEGQTIVRVALYGARATVSTNPDETSSFFSPIPLEAIAAQWTREGCNFSIFPPNAVLSWCDQSQGHAACTSEPGAIGLELVRGQVIAACPNGGFAVEGPTSLDANNLCIPERIRCVSLVMTD